MLDARSRRSTRPPSWRVIGELGEEKGVVSWSFLLAEAARSECAPSMRAMETTPAVSLDTGNEQGNRSVDARSQG